MKVFIITSVVILSSSAGVQAALTESPSDKRDVSKYSDCKYPEEKEPAQMSSKLRVPSSCKGKEKEELCLVRAECKYDKDTTSTVISAMCGSAGLPSNCAISTPEQILNCLKDDQINVDFGSAISAEDIKSDVDSQSEAKGDIQNPGLPVGSPNVEEGAGESDENASERVTEVDLNQM